MIKLTFSPIIAIQLFTIIENVRKLLLDFIFKSFHSTIVNKKIKIGTEDKNVFYILSYQCPFELFSIQEITDIIKIFSIHYCNF